MANHASDSSSVAEGKGHAMSGKMDAAVSDYERLLPEIRAKHGATWAVVAKASLQGAFRSYGEAAEFALRNFAPGEFLIRNTHAQAPYIPFVSIEG